MAVSQEFFFGRDEAKRHHAVDTSNFETLQQLRDQLGQIFSFADPSSLSFHNSRSNRCITSLDEIRASHEPLELRASQSSPVRPPPGPQALPLVGNHYELFPDPIGNYERLLVRHGPLIKIVNMGTTTYITNDADISRHVLREGHLFTKTTSSASHPLFYMNDQEALFTCDSSSPAFSLAHKFVPPALSPRAVAHYAPLIQDSGRAIFEVFDQLSNRDLACNVYQYMMKLASEVVFRVMVGQRLGHFHTLDGPPSLVIRLYGDFLRLMKKMSLRPKWYGRLPFGEPARLQQVRHQLFEAVAKEMDASVTPDGGILSLEDASSPLQAACVADFLARARDRQGNGLPRDVLLGNVVVVLGAGFTTSASLLSWSIYSLVKYDGNQDRLLQELVDHGADGERVWTHDQLHAMSFLDSFVKETLRLHSPSFQTGRNAKRDVVLPGGYLIPAGSIVIPCFPTIHKNPKYWDNPTRFDPDRWAAPQVAREAAKKGTFTPFAAGARGCVGFNLALLQVKMILAELVYRYQFEDASTEEVVYDPEFLVIRPLNFYASPIRRTEWPAPSKKSAEKDKTKV